ncbi:hypothetical protein AGDE_14861 [Angomonas deanei]|uniref:Uncharacterized protein n=1 Tax=Angomonas deanei TaxID=59799 RepID=A0A7G2C5U1_9TRYP|nr:hypothetical protein AGDE_14861 [Angomonas deanei]CAD2214117.1 hypothetical protein, conserved [Angomonas deanei]|eukprot:EPY20097.1 hypothetical protein AGDE_14861 [Angomonas deanei]
MTTLLKIINASSEYVQLLFASYGGVVRMRLLVAKCIQQKNYTTLAAVVESTANLKITSWDTPTQDAWKTNTEQRLTADLTWLKQLSFLPAGKEAVFRAMLGLIEQRYIFVKPCSSTHPYFKRPRDPSDVVREDNLDFQKWKVARVNTLGATRLPYALRASAFTSHLEGEVVEYLNIKVEYAEQTQANWKMRIEKMVADQSMSPGAVSVPVFHDPYELLNIGVDHKN